MKGLLALTDRFQTEKKGQKSRLMIISVLFSQIFFEDFALILYPFAKIHFSSPFFLPAIEPVPLAHNKGTNYKAFLLWASPGQPKFVYFHRHHGKGDFLIKPTPGSHFQLPPMISMIDHLSRHTAIDTDILSGNKSSVL